MHVLIREAVVTVPITTVTIGTDLTDPEHTHLHMFFCFNCGTPLGQYKGFVYTIMPGSIPGTLPWIQRCATCKRKIAINSIV